MEESKQRFRLGGRITTFFVAASLATLTFFYYSPNGVNFFNRIWGKEQTKQVLEDRTWQEIQKNIEYVTMKENANGKFHVVKFIFPYFNGDTWDYTLDGKLYTINGVKVTKPLSWPQKPTWGIRNQPQKQEYQSSNKPQTVEMYVDETTRDAQYYREGILNAIQSRESPKEIKSIKAINLRGMSRIYHVFFYGGSRGHYFLRNGKFTEGIGTELIERIRSLEEQVGRGIELANTTKSVRY